MVRMTILCVVDRGFNPQWGETKNDKIVLVSGKGEIAA